MSHLGYSSVDKKNSIFWSEPCGTNAADNLELNIKNENDLVKFDEWYKLFYPYLFKYLEGFDLQNMSVLEVGIGMGTVSRYLNERCKQLTLLDIAPGAISQVQSTLRNPGNVSFLCESILEYETDNKFDLVIAIGSLHHTGDLTRALSKVENLVEKDGRVFVMVYYAFQPRRIIRHPFRSLHEYLLTRQIANDSKYAFEENDTALRAKADANREGEAAPYTAFSSRKLFYNRDKFLYEVKLENFHNIPIFTRLLSRNFFLKHFSKYFGCDIYAIGDEKIHK